MRILALPGDPGGVAAWAPCLAVLADDSEFQLDVRPRAVAADVLDDFDIPNHSLDVALFNGDNDINVLALRLLDQTLPDLILTGSCFEPGLELIIARKGKERGIPVISLLDSWTHYRRRYQMFGESDLAVDQLPHVICVMDDFAQQEMVEEGFPEKCLHIVGHPGLDRFLNLQGRLDHNFRAKGRTDLGIGTDEKLIVFFSQPLKEMFGPPGSSTYRGYDESTVLKELLGAVNAISSEDGDDTICRVFVKPHPKEDPDNIRVATSGNIDLEVCFEDDLIKLIEVADVVVGMTSIVLVMSFLAGRPTVSIQPGLCVRDELMLSRAGHLTPVTNSGDLVDILRRELTSPCTLTSSVDEVLKDGQSVARVIALCRNLLNGEISVDKISVTAKL